MKELSLVKPISGKDHHTSQYQVPQLHAPMLLLLTQRTVSWFDAVQVQNALFFGSREPQPEPPCSLLEEQLALWNPALFCQLCHYGRKLYHNCSQCGYPNWSVEEGQLSDQRSPILKLDFLGSWKESNIIQDLVGEKKKLKMHYAKTPTILNSIELNSNKKSQHIPKCQKLRLLS